MGGSTIDQPIIKVYRQKLRRNIAENRRGQLESQLFLN